MSFTKSPPWRNPVAIGISSPSGRGDTAPDNPLDNPLDPHLVYLWHDAGRVQTCASGYELDHGDACLCRINASRFRTGSARRYTICG